ncbi:MAG: DUF2723 domain-containing protein [Candidatus Zixiibacteriota bacterium]|nr:MAG: DUF2723 domain-containing protein [candidate division Zixibacteria bacterium]
MRLFARSRIDPVNAFIAFGVWLFVLVVYTLTKAPTLSFWDCGEFIAASYIMGIPHPPGSPLYVLLGRLFSVIPMSSDIAVRVNMLSAVTSSLAALFGYLALVRILRAWCGGNATGLSRVLMYGGGVAGTLFLAFGLTNWNNSVETEVYGLSMMMFMAVFWLALVYWDHAGTAFGERVMLLVFFIAYIGIGVHMTTFLVVPPVALLFFLKKETPQKIWLAVGAFFIFELYLIFAMSSLPDEIPYYVPVTIVAILYLFYVFSYDKVPSIYLYIAGGFMISILPLAGLALKTLLRPNSPDPTAGGSAVLSGIGLAALALLTLTAVILVVRYVRAGKPHGENLHQLVAALFVLAAAIMAGVVTLNLRGYGLFLIATALVGLIFIAGLFRYIRWPTLVAVAAVSLVILGVREMVAGMLIAAVVIPILGVTFRQPGWKNAMLILLVAVLGYSVNIFIPVRSAHQPVINENNPSQSLTATINFIERKQYGSMSMVERMFKRRAEWQNQFGNYRRMGFWGFFSEQFGLRHLKFIILFVIGLYGMWEILRRRAQLGVPLVILLLLASIGLVLYMNFADGTRRHPVTGADYIEVRDRDYFFTPAFMLFGTAIGLGISAIVQFVRESSARLPAVTRKTIIAASLVLFILPVFTVARNYHLADRSDNYIAFDYAWNILVSAEPNAVLITGGDNDTFPLWCLQEVYGIRKDVDVVNLSLAGTKWYIKQLRSTLGIRMSWTDEHIDSLVVFRDQYGVIHRLSHQVVTEIINQNYGVRPINYANTISSASRTYAARSIDSLLTLQGMVWRLDRAAGSGLALDVEACVDLFTNPDKFRFRGVNDPAIYKNETTLRLTRNYIPSFILIADSLRKAGQPDRAEWLMEKAVAFIPYSEDGISYLASIYAATGNRQGLIRLVDTAEYGDKRWLKMMLGRLERNVGDYAAAERTLQQTMREFPTYRPVIEELIRLYYQMQQPQMIPAALRFWLQVNPDDAEMRGLLSSFERELERLDSLEDGKR